MSQYIRGFEMLNNNALNKDLGFTEAERQVYSLRGLLPRLVLTIEQQEKLFLTIFRGKSNELEKYSYLMDLHSRNVKLFFYIVMRNVVEILPFIYTPTVGSACLKYDQLYTVANGLFITIEDVNQIEKILLRWPEKHIKAICVTDGERILGLGDLGAHGMGISVGKLTLYTALGGVDPSYCLPIVLDVGTNNKTLLKNEFYLGLKIDRVSNEKYEHFVDEFMMACTKVYGPDILIQFEDFGNHYAFHFLQKYRMDYCMFNDDIQGTAAVVVAGIINATKIIDKKVSENKILFYGAGEAALGIASLLVMVMEEDGLSDEQARKGIFLVDSKGLIVENRPKGGITLFKSIFAQKMEPMDSLLEIVKKICPSILIGAAAQKGAFSPEILAEMARLNTHPVIMALSNPTSKSECTAEEAYTHTKGKAIFSSGSPFGEFKYQDQVLVPGQANNSYIFPGLAFSVIHCKIHPIHDKLFLEAAKGLAKKVTSKDLKSGKIYPGLNNIGEVSLAVSLAVCEYAFRSNTANLKPEPADKKAFLLDKIYKPAYDSHIPASASSK